MTILDLARLHERILVMSLLPTFPDVQRPALIKRAGAFFAAVIAPTVKTHGGAGEARRLNKIIGTLSDRTVELAAANRLLGLEIVRRKAVEASLNKSERHHLKSLEKSNLLKQQLQGLSRQILTAQENERRKIIRELHDVIAQSLMGINVRLATLKAEANIHTRGLDRNIALTQKMVTKAAGIVNRFARDLHPTVLDDLGLIPALHSLMKSFTSRTGVLTHLTAFSGVEKLDAARRTVFYRVAEESLGNIARHARATRVEVTLLRDARSVRMEVADDGKSFHVQSVLQAGANKPLGLLGMRERVEMVGGSFQIISEPGSGTKIIARIPVGKAIVNKWALETLESNSQTP
jgi:signal transduction histidine kinase